jgi:hypothetical protein
MGLGILARQLIELPLEQGDISHSALELSNLGIKLFCVLVEMAFTHEVSILIVR